MRTMTVVAFVLLAVGASCGATPPDEAKARAAFLERREAIEAFEDRVLTTMAMRPEIDDAQMTSLVVGAGALGLDGHGMLPSVAPCPPGTKHGDVAPDDGLAIDRHRIGWGLYQTAWEAGGTKHGDGNDHPGITVKWRLGAEGSVLGDPVQLCFLLDDTPRPP
jgi:hypothetical protein